ncbi:hypothetical protein SBOR_7510 [Sclerotinia borealis F-4128]|uniref:2EXR domain-containing protein n=1 Tax=Sclerotinia borealis (strain F-4128) TaxID=1432307 RepID=W9CBZ5_SCLBF|nr:hypothetical protein SBOR_7510 [Sclerotinia borealis F-4128]
MASLAHQIKTRRWEKKKKHTLEQRREGSISTYTDQDSIDEHLQSLATKHLPILVIPETTLPTFALFQDLPPELRLKIWKIASDEPRFIGFSETTRKKERCYYMVKTRYRNWPVKIETRWCFLGGLTYEDNAPCLLWVCHDAREIAKKNRSQPFIKAYGNPIYINFSVNIILFDCHRSFTQFYDYIGAPEQEKIFATERPAIILGPCNRDRFESFS